MVSPLHKKNSWQPFYECCHRVISKRRVDAKDLLEILQYVDPETNFEFSGFYGKLIGPGFISGRISLYYKGFEKFVSKNLLEFDKAPLKVIQEFNHLLGFLFGERGNALFIDESLARDASPDKMIQRMRVLERMNVLDEKRDKPVQERKKIVPQIIENAPVYIDLSHPFLEQYRTAYQAKQLSEQEIKTLSQQVAVIEKAQAQFDSDLGASLQAIQERYPDLAKKMSQMREEMQPCVCTIEDLERNVQEHFHELKTNLAHLQTEVAQRDTLISQVDQLIDRFIGLLDQFEQYQDLSSEVSKVKTQIGAERILKSELAKIPVEKLASLFEQKKRVLQEILKSFQETYLQLVQEVKKLRLLRTEQDCMLFYRLNEFFSGKIPYPDEFESLELIQKDFDAKITYAVREFDSGKCSLQEYTRLLNELPYDHDLLLIRQENSFRDKRLLDFRHEVLKLKSTTFRLMAFSSGFTGIFEDLEALYNKLCDPFTLFSSVLEREDINRVVRDTWIEFEHIQVRFEQMMSQPVPIADDVLLFLKDLFDDIEHVVAMKVGTRPSIVQRYPLQELSISQLFEILDTIEKLYPFASPLLLFRAALHSDERRALLQQLYTIEVRKQYTITLAKSCQSFRVHEDDRVDQMLELLEGFGREQELHDIVDRRRRILLNVSEEIFLDFRSLDERALQIKDRLQFQELIQELDGMYRYRDLVKSRIEHAAQSDAYAFYLAWVNRLKVWVDALEIKLFEEVKSQFPDWVTPFLPLCAEIRSRIEICQFTPMKKERLQELVASIRQSIQHNIQLAPQECLVTLDQFEKELDAAPVRRQENIFFFPGSIKQE